MTMKILFLVRDMKEVIKKTKQEDLINHIDRVSMFEKFHDVMWWGPFRNGYDERVPITKLVDKFKPDIIFKYGFRMPFEIDIDKVTIPKIIYLVDYFPQYLSYKGVQQKYTEYLTKVHFDAVIGPVTYIERYALQTKITDQAYTVPFGVNIDRFKKFNINKKIDVAAMFVSRDDVYPNRMIIKTMIESLGLNILTGKKSVDKYVESINKTKIFVTSNNIFHSLSMKYTEVMSCGTFLLADRPEDLGLFGYKDGYHLVIYNGLDDLRDKIFYFLDHEKEREEIAVNGMNFVRKNFSNEMECSRILKIMEGF